MGEKESEDLSGKYEHFPKNWRKIGKNCITLPNLIRGESAHIPIVRCKPPINPRAGHDASPPNTGNTSRKHGTAIQNPGTYPKKNSPKPWTTY